MTCKLILNRFFLGVWSLSRIITPGKVMMRGDALFKAVSQTDLIYEEVVQVEDAGQVISEASRSYIYRIIGETEITILFNDGPDKGKLFHHLSFKQENDCLVAKSSHQCIDDIYDSAYVLDGDRMFVTHDVTGPHKDYTSETIYNKCSN